MVAPGPGDSTNGNPDEALRPTRPMPPGQWDARRLVVAVGVVLVLIWLFTDLTPFDLMDAVLRSSDGGGGTSIEEYNHRNWWERILDDVNGCPVPGECHGLPPP